MGQFLCYPSDHSYSLNSRKYICSRTLGEGGYSIVYLVQDYSKRKYALKVMICQTNEQLEIGNKEINTISLFDHPNIIKLIDHSIIDSKKLRDTKEILLLTPYYKGGTLQDVLDNQRTTFGKDCKKSVYNETQALELFKQICDAIAVLHNYRNEATSTSGISHRDIKPGNILLSEEDSLAPRAILTDFGSVSTSRITITSRKEALELQDEIDANTTPFYRAPELFDIKSDQILDERIDIWSLGCILYAIAYNKSPFELDQDNERLGGSVQLTVLQGLPKQPPNTDFSIEFYQLIERMLHQDYNQRPFINQVITDIHNLLNNKQQR